MGRNTDVEKRMDVEIMEVVGEYNGWLVLLSVVVSILSSYTALQIVNRMASVQRTRYKWLTLGSLTFGGGIWSMHFIAMLAYDMGMPVVYDVALVVLSILAAVASSFTAFFIISKGVDKKIWRFTGAVLIALSIVSMHYIGMDAMKMNAFIEYNPWLVAVSGAIALAVSFVGLRLFSLYAQKGKVDNKKDHWKVWGSSTFMGMAISGMHYTGMESATFFMKGRSQSVISGPVVDPTMLAWMIAGGVIATIGFLIVLIKFDTEMETTNTRLDVANQMYRSILESANDAVVTSDEKGIVLAWNKSAEQTFGYMAEEMIGEPLTKMMPAHYRNAHQQGIERYNQTRNARVIGKTVELEGLHKEGSTFPMELSLSTVEDDGRTYFTGIIRDITERIENEERIRELVYKDDLTHLPNRRALYEHLAGYIQDVHEKIAVMFLDFDRFKQVNDVYGHRMGDLLLNEGALRVKSHLTEGDLLARQSGDEFIIVLPDTSVGGAKSIAESIIEEIAAPFKIEDRDLYISGSIGISLYPEDGTTPDLLIKRADTSMYQAKQDGGGQYCFYTEEMDQHITRKLQLENGLRKAIEQEGIEVYYQPQVDVRSGEIIGFEALARWNHPEFGFIRPDEFIPLAEETKLIVPLGEKILLEACRQYQQWMDEGHDLERISVNLSAIQFMDPTVVSTVESVLKQTKVAPAHLEIELTESIVQDSTQALPVMNRLKKMGIQLALDDFGTGFSSLSYLKDFPLDTLKVDRSFIQTIHENEKDRAVVDTVIQLADRLGLSVIAEGVETEVQLDYLRSRGCAEYQGYVFSKPLSKTEASALLTQSMAM
ncbi:EAL domain-containing protein [Halobacillus trueperi]|uniref:EAL domain-containing protein n=1 Tax=Halobacillus trueperi TaxID=156205 RepID=UPI0037370BA0